MMLDTAARPRPSARRVRAAGRNRRVIGFAAATGALLVLVTGSMLVGSNALPVSTVLELLIEPDGSLESVIVHEQRLPRAVLLVVVGAALGVAGALMQSLTRNPLADPGILGVNAGASLAVVLAVAVAGATSIWFYVWFAFLGAALASIAVAVLGAVGTGFATPARIALAGVAISMAVTSFVQTVILSNQHAFNEFRFWAAGSAEGRGLAITGAVVGFVLLVLVIAFALAPSLNALALGDDTGRALGVNVQRTRIATMTAVTLLAGAATAAVGPISFIGLAVPYVARLICGSDQRWVLPLSAVIAPSMLLAADILARVIIAPQEIQVGIVAAILGGPLFIVIVRRRRIEAL